MKILHVLRAPVGGLFRHVVDLANGQMALGHRVGVIAASQSGGARSEAILADLAARLPLGLSRMSLHRQPGPFDLTALWHVAARIRQTGADVVHGHGAKGGALARLALAPHDTLRVYTPHGGSLHSAVGGRIHLMLEKALMRRGGLYLFESAYSHDAYLKKIGQPQCITQVVHNGVGSSEFEPIALDDKATDVVFLGELRELKGVDVLIDAIAMLRAKGRAVSATIVGDGPDEARFRAQVERLGLTDAVRFRGSMPARAAFALGQVVAVPSRAESLPYVVLEAAAAGKPLVATRVGGIPEIFGALAGRLVTPDDAPALAHALADAHDNPAMAKQVAAQLQAGIRDGFSTEVMVKNIMSSYELAIRTAWRAEGERHRAELVEN